MALEIEELRNIVIELLRKPGHEKVRALVYQLLTQGLNARSEDLEFEERLPAVHGRLDALWGETVIEFKLDLRRELEDAELQLRNYLSDKERTSGRKHLGIATDGSRFRSYECSDQKLSLLAEYVPLADRPRELLEWLESVVCVGPEIAPTPEKVKIHLGRASTAWHVARPELEAIWSDIKGSPEPKLKRQLWSDYLTKVYGTEVDENDLFFQHTYLSIVAKTIATHVLGAEVTDAQSLLDGVPFQQAGIFGAVEADFFDWLLVDARGADLVKRIALQTKRFKLRDVTTDVLKGLYESLVDPETRHDLGEYYTPDWLAHAICQEAIDKPLDQRVLDPSCGSGTFVFHAVRRFFDASEAAGMPNRTAVANCVLKVMGVDIHPLAVQIARVTYLLAIGEERLKDRPQISIPVYLGDSLQWNTAAYMGDREVFINVPDEPTALHFPAGLASRPDAFDKVLAQMLELSERDASADAFRSWLAASGDFNRAEQDVLGETYEIFSRLHREGRNHIWGFVARNIVRPVWLSWDAERPDVIVGNPPWLSYRYMGKPMQETFKARCEEKKIWAGGKVATHQDLSAYFLARCCELYFKPTSKLVFVMPYAVLSRQQYAPFRKGWFSSGNRKVQGPPVVVRFDEAWAFRDVLPLFPVPSCVLFVSRRPGASGGALPDTVMAAVGQLPRRDASPDEANALIWQSEPWPTNDDTKGGSFYRPAFKQGATFVPRMLCTVVETKVGKFGSNLDSPLVESRRSKQEKKPWNALPGLRSNVEVQFIRDLYLGECIAPYRTLGHVLAIVPWDPELNRLLDSEAAVSRGFTALGKWLIEAEALWRTHGQARLSFNEQLDYYGKLVAQFPTKALRVVFSKAGSLQAATLIRDDTCIVDHTLYWASVNSEAEGHYLCSIFNSETARKLVERQQATGQWGARHFDKVMLGLPIPKYSASIELHLRLATLGKDAETEAARVPLAEGIGFIKARQRIRAALVTSSLAEQIDDAVSDLLTARAGP